MTEPLKYTVDLPYARNRVWAAWTHAEELAKWLCLRAVVDPAVGGRYELFWNPDPSKPESDSTLGCRVLSVDPPRLLRFTWRGADEVADVMNAPDVAPTEVEVRLLPILEGTRLKVSHEGWGDGEGWDRARAWFDRAWSGALKALRQHLSGG